VPTVIVNQWVRYHTRTKTIHKTSSAKGIFHAVSTFVWRPVPMRVNVFWVKSWAGVKIFPCNPPVCECANLSDAFTDTWLDLAGSTQLQEPSLVEDSAKRSLRIVVGFWLRIVVRWRRGIKIKHFSLVQDRNDLEKENCWEGRRGAV